MGNVINKIFNIGEVLLDNLACQVNQIMFVIGKNIMGQVVVQVKVIQVNVEEFEFGNYQFNFIVDNIVSLVELELCMVKFNCVGLRNVY